MIVICCKCRRIRYGGEWTEAKHVEGGPVSHTYCPPCAEEAMVEINEVYQSKLEDEE